MASTKLFPVVGISTHKGRTKIRFANDSMRIKTLERNGHTDIDFITLPEPMTKADTIKYLRNIKWQQGVAEAQDAMDLIIYRNPSGSIEDATQLAFVLAPTVANETA